MRILLAFLSVVIAGMTLLAPVQLSVAKSKSRISKCTTANCLYREIVVKSENVYLEDDCKSLDKRSLKNPVPQNLGQLCRVLIARAKASNRKTNACIKERLLTPDYLRNIPEHEVWVYSDSLFSKYGQVEEKVKTLDNASFKSLAVHNINVLKRKLDFNVQKEVHYVTRKRKRKRTKKVTITRSMSFNVYYCVSGTEGQYRYVPYYYILRTTPDYQPESRKRLRRITRRMSKALKAQIRQEHEDERKRLAKLKKQRRQFKIVKQAYVEKLPQDAAKILAQLKHPGLKSRYRNYQLVDFNGDGNSDLVFLEDGFNKFRPGVCLYQKGKASCKLIMPKRYVPSSYFHFKTEMVPRPKKGIDLVISDSNYDDQQTKFNYVYDEGLLSRKLTKDEKIALKEAKKRTVIADRRKARAAKRASKKADKKSARKPKKRRTRRRSRRSRRRRR